MLLQLDADAIVIGVGRTGERIAAQERRGRPVRVQSQNDELSRQWGRAVGCPSGEVRVSENTVRLS